MGEMVQMAYIISVDELKRTDKNNTVVVDVRFDLQDPEAGRKAYLENHIPGAVYLDLNKDLSGKVAKHGGSHPLPDMDLFAKKLGNIGINHEIMVVVYDQHNDMFAPRFWWMLHYLGHEKVYVLDGGYDAWITAGNEVTKQIPLSNKKVFKPKYQECAVVNMKEVKEKLNKKTAILLDSRSKDRYLGKTEPMYQKAGHIPGAKNYFWKGVLRENGKWKNANELETHFSLLPKNAEIIVSCGSGVSATPNIMALKAAGYQNVKLYPGSYSDWISYEENDIETKDES